MARPSIGSKRRDAFGRRTVASSVNVYLPHVDSLPPTRAGRLQAKNEVPNLTDHGWCKMAHKRQLPIAPCFVLIVQGANRNPASRITGKKKSVEFWPRAIELMAAVEFAEKAACATARCYNSAAACRALAALREQPPGRRCPEKRTCFQAVIAMARHSWTVIFAMHGIAGGLAWWLLPHGFPPSHLRFWSNTVVPLALVAMMLLAVVAQFKHWDRYVRAAILG